MYRSYDRSFGVEAVQAFCRSYAIQGNLCYGCKWRFGHGQYAKETDFDLFDPKESWRELMSYVAHGSWKKQEVEQ